MTQQPRIELAIYIDNKEYAMRVWPAVPRVGDEIMVRRMADEQPAWKHRGEIDANVQKKAYRNRSALVPASGGR